ncbi:MAG: hypothetical protein A4E28_01217 [Methanocella sp. PtaU1.Bin125]|nr:MAG: hypothetical protein A4E28_01217 [Methanocella sp. PtaU1.Bin125]
MNIEISYIHLIRNVLRFRHHGGKAPAILHAFLQRFSTTPERYMRQDAQYANVSREQYHAAAMAQLQSYRFNR